MNCSSGECNIFRISFKYFDTPHHRLTSRVAAKMFVFVISRNFSISCFAKSTSNFAKFRETRNHNLGENFTISRNTKSKFGQHLAILQERDDFLTLTNEKIIYFWDTMFFKSKWSLICFQLGQNKSCFPDFLKAQK